MTDGIGYGESSKADRRGPHPKGRLPHPERCGQNPASCRSLAKPAGSVSGTRLLKTLRRGACKSTPPLCFPFNDALLDHIRKGSQRCLCQYMAIGYPLSHLFLLSAHCWGGVFLILMGHNIIAVLDALGGKVHLLPFFHFHVIASLLPSNSFSTLEELGRSSVSSSRP